MAPREWRPITWAILVFNLVMIAWFVISVAGAEPASITSCEEPAQERSLCELERDAQALDTSASSPVLIWAGGDILLAVVWWATNRRRKHRPIWKAVKIIVGVGLGGFVLAGGIILLIQGSDAGRAKSALPAFDEHLSAYAFATTAPSGADPYIRGRAITVLVPSGSGEANATVNGRLYQFLPASLRAENPTEVETVIRTDCDWLPSFYLGDMGASATYWQCQCEVELVDVSASPPTAVAVDRTFEGMEPPETLAGGGAHYSGCPWFDIAGYLADLPRR
jgi:hypothetical protein